jgi:hypothetical protein
MTTPKAKRAPARLPRKPKPLKIRGKVAAHVWIDDAWPPFINDLAFKKPADHRRLGLWLLRFAHWCDAQAARRKGKA